KELENLRLLKNLVGHPHVVTLMDVWQIAGYLVTRWEFSSEGSLEKRLQEYQAQGLPGIPVNQLLRYIYDAAQGIDFLNNRGIVHRDIKPQNLLLFFNRVKVADLGLAKFVGASTASHTGAGTWGYLPPEAYRGELSATVDLYSLAATYINLRTGREPFGLDPPEIFRHQEMGQPILDNLSQAEAQVILHALAPRKEDRPQHGAQVWVRSLYKALQPSTPLKTPRRENQERKSSEVLVSEASQPIPASPSVEEPIKVVSMPARPMPMELVPAEPISEPGSPPAPVIYLAEVIESDIPGSPPMPLPPPPSPWMGPPQTPPLWKSVQTSVKNGNPILVGGIIGAGIGFLLGLCGGPLLGIFVAVFTAALGACIGLLIQDVLQRPNESKKPENISRC
ncbi:MAG TPA: serine/threonine-protein kinase, partial [Thermoguttaceae bacterium]|nr:serine/threonine-protein kinase [Thermoguttaceae bacterium]